MDNKESSNKKEGVSTEKNFKQTEMKKYLNDRIKIELKCQQVKTKGKLSPNLRTY